MIDKNKLGYGVVGLILLLSLGLNVQPSDTHYCQIRNITYHCDSLSQYYSLENGKCINDVLPNKLCRSGWQEIFRDVKVEVEKTKAKSYLCNQTKCIEIKGG